MEYPLSLSRGCRAHFGPCFGVGVYMGGGSIGLSMTPGSLEKVFEQLLVGPLVS